MSDYLTKRNGHWQFVRRVPLEFAELDPRGIVKHSTKIAVSDDKRGLKAGRIADVMNRELEAYWRGLSEGKAQEAADRYAEARRRARMLGFDYVETPDLAMRPTAEILARLEKLMSGGLVEDVGARTAMLGGEKKPAVMLSEIYPMFENQHRAEIKDMSADQLRRWKNQYAFAMNDFIGVVKDKPLSSVTHNDILDYINYLEDRVAEEELVIRSANNYIGHVSKMVRTVNQRLRLGLPSLFADMRLKGGKKNVRPSFAASFVQDKILAPGALAELDSEARDALLVMAETGLRVSEAVNLSETTIHLHNAVPYVEVKPDGRRVKTADSIRKIPLVGIALDAIRRQPKGFTRYMDKGASFSNYVNAYLLDRGLRPTREHTVYSLRHTFKDRLVAVEAQDSLIESLMGHADDHPKYGEGPSLELKLKWLQRIAFQAP